jgi:hypothetical protein
LCMASCTSSCGLVCACATNAKSNTETKMASEDLPLILLSEEIPLKPFCWTTWFFLTASS